MSDDSESDWQPALDDLEQRRVAAAEMGGAERVARHHQAGKLTARERIGALADDFVEIGRLAGDGAVNGFVAGVGQVDGRPVAIGAEDFTVAGGSIGDGESAKRQRLAELAVQERIPLVMLLEGAGHRAVDAGTPAGRRSPGDLMAQADASGRVPFAAAVLGPSAGHGALSAPLADFTVMTAAASIFSAGPPLVRTAIGEEITKEALGGPDVALVSGVVHNFAAADSDALAQVRRWLSYLPSSAWERPTSMPSDDGERMVPEVLDIVPHNPRQAYDIARVVGTLVDRDSWFEIQPRFGRSIMTGLARLEGQAVAIVANQPNHLGGTIDVDAADKAAHFIRVADSFHVPLVFLTDNPGVLAGSASERAGILRHAGRMFASQHAATVPKLQLTIRKAYGFGSTVMAMNPFDGQTLNLAWPGVTFAAMPTQGTELGSVYRSAASMSIDDVIHPADSRNALIGGLRIATRGVVPAPKNHVVSTPAVWR